MEVVNGQFLWVEKYRPQVVADCILPVDIKKKFLDMVSKKEIQNLLLSGDPGMGKTTVAKALCNELDSDVLYINASVKNGIDVLKTEISQFASTVSMLGGLKVVILDEAERLSQATQLALRAFIEQFSKNCRFIFTCNNKVQIIEALHSRLVNIDFKVPKDEKSKLALEFFKRLTTILNNEGVEFDKKLVAEVVERFFPDFRKTLNVLQFQGNSGVITEIGDELGNLDDLYKFLKEKKFNEVRNWVGLNIDGDAQFLVRALYDNASTLFKKTSLPQLVLILGDYQYKAAFVADHQINAMACLTEIMSSCEFEG